MKNVWKGLVIGGLTGAGVGLAMDLMTKVGDGAVEVKELAQEHAPEALHWAKGVTERATELIRDTDVPEKVQNLAHRISESAAAERARGAAGVAAERARDAAGTVSKVAAERAKDAAGTVSKVAAERARDAAGTVRRSAKQVAAAAAGAGEAVAKP